MLKKKRDKKIKKEDVLVNHHFVKKDLDDEQSDDTKQNPSTDYVSEQLVEIYKNQDGSLPDMTSFQKRKSQKTLRAFFTLLFSCLCLIGVVFAGFFLWAPKQSFSQDGVSVEIVGNENVTSGETVQYRIRYRNSENVPVTKTKLVLHYPVGFQFQESSLPSANETNTEWDFGTLDAGENGFLDIYGSMQGDLGKEESIRVFLNYTPANFSSEFQSVSFAKIIIGSSPVALTISGPSTTAQGQPLSLVFTLTSRDATSTLENLSLVIDPGVGFVKKSSNPESDNFGTWQWSIPRLKGEKSVTVNGAFIANPSATQHTLNAKVVATTSGTEAQKKTFILAQKEYTVQFDESQLLGQFTINGANANLNITPGETLSVQAALKNTFSSPITNIRASVTFDAPSYQDKSILNWSALQDKNNNSIQGQQIGTDIRRGVIAWDKTHIAALGSLAANAEIPFAFTLPVKSSSETLLSNFKEHKIQATFEVQYEQNGKKQTFVSAPVEMILNSDLHLTSDVKKEKNLNSKDDFTVTWNLVNTFHELKDVQISGQIFGDVAWEEGDLSVSIGKLEFDPKEKKILWKIDTLPASSNPLKATFSFVRNAFNSTQTQLISKVNLSAKDTVTGKDILILKSETPNSP